MSHIEEIENFRKDIEFKSDAESADIKNKINDSLAEIDLIYSQILEDQLNLDKSDVSGEIGFISLLQIQVMTLDCEIKIRDILIEAKDYQLKQYEKVFILGELQDKLSDYRFDIQDRMIAYKSDKVDNYQKGVKLKAKTANDKWTLAKKYLLEEILKHKTLTAARKAAAKRADIVCEDRQLVKRLPDPRKKA